MKNTLIVLTLIIILGGLFYVARVKESSVSMTPVNNETAVNPTGSAATPNPNVDLLRAGGSSYLDPKGLYSFLYPNDYSLDTQDSKHIRIYKRSETQRPQGEMTDGVLMVFESIDLGTQSLEQWVDTHIKESTADGTTKISQNKKAITLNTFPAFTYQLNGFSDTTYVVLQKSTQSPSAVIIAYAVNDPEGKNYQSEVDAVLSTFELLK